MRETPFKFFAPIRIWEKADAPDNRKWRIGGIISTETPDRENEVVLQQGLDFTDFLRAGWFNDNHSKKTTDILGYPEEVKRFKRGAQLPDGSKAKANCSWVEGYLLPKWNKAKEVWELAQALSDTDRRLRFSVEGKVEKREGPGGRIVAKAKVRNVAVTNAPINDDTRLEVLAKSLRAIEAGEDDGEVVKGLTVGTPATPGTPPFNQTMTGEGAGQVLGRESLEHDEDQLHVLTYPPTKPRKLKRDDQAHKSLTDSEAISWVRARYPGVSDAAARQVVAVARAIKSGSQTRRR
jgi:hypothetical protein